MAEGRPRGYEYKHIECAQEPVLVDLVVNDHAKFFWELMNTQTVVSKESHIEEGKFDSDNLYSVTTTERFVAIDFRRPTDIPELERIRQVEQQYREICVALTNVGGSPLNYYALPIFESFPIQNLFTSLFDPGYWLWEITLGQIRDLRKIGVMGFVFRPYGYWKAKQGDRAKQVEQFDILKKDLENLLDSSRDILSV